MEEEEESVGVVVDDEVNVDTDEGVDERAGKVVGSEVIEGEEVEEGELIGRAEARGAWVHEEDEVGDRDFLEDILKETEGLDVVRGAWVWEMTEVTEEDIEIVHDMSDVSADGEVKAEGTGVNVEVGEGVWDGDSVVANDTEKRPVFVGVRVSRRDAVCAFIVAEVEGEKLLRVVKERVAEGEGESVN